MSTLTKPWFSPSDRRWQGNQRFMLPLILVKAIVFIPFFVLCIVEISLYRKWIPFYDDSNQNYTKGDYWLRWAGLTLVPEIIHTVLQIYLIVTSRFHPTFALTGSCILFVCWMTSALINAFLAYSNEISFEHHDEWLRLCWGEVGMQSFMALLYIPMVVFSGVAVHWYRMSRKEDGMKWKVADGEREGSV